VRRGALLGSLVAVLANLAAHAGAQDTPAHVLAADASTLGVITLAFHGPSDGTVRFRERVGTQVVELGSAPVDATGTAVLHDAATFLCNRSVRHFEAVETMRDGRELDGRVDVRTASCRERMWASAPTRIRRGALAAVRLLDTWRLGGIAPRLCIAPPRRQFRCRDVTFGRGAVSASRRFRGTTAGTWHVEVRYGSRRLRRVVGVGPGGRAGRTPPMYLVTGDSSVQGLDAPLGVELAERADVRGEFHPGTGLSAPFSPWPGLPAKQRRAEDPAVTVIALGANEGSAMHGAECCGEAWSAEYARRAERLMRSYRRVVWLTLPLPRDDRKRDRTAVVNAAVVRAAAAVRGTRVIRLDELFSPGGVYRERIRHHGQDVQVRQPDGVHLTLPALSIIAALVADAVRTPRR
jgi:hypothetical protein